MSLCYILLVTIKLSYTTQTKVARRNNPHEDSNICSCYITREWSVLKHTRNVRNDRKNQKMHIVFHLALDSDYKFKDFEN